jgi:hypothetical protein
MKWPSILVAVAAGAALASCESAGDDNAVANAQAEDFNLANTMSVEENDLTTPAANGTVTDPAPVQPPQPADPHAGHDMANMSEHDMNDMADRPH